MVSQKESNSRTKRSVLILDFNDDLPDFEKNLTQLGWDSIIASNLRQSIRIITQPGLRVAIAVVQSDQEQKIFNAVDKLQGIAPKVKWLAIPMQHPIPSQRYKSKLSAHFVDYYHCPIDWVLFSNSLGHLWGMAQLHDDTVQGTEHHHQNPIMNGHSKVIQSLKHDLEKIANADSSVLISGETGTGKGLCAQLIHGLSDRQNEPFIVVNCGALPPSLIHSELFGHEKGAYTGAETRYIGHIERANNGTLFLDEIGDLPLALQVNLLRFIDDKVIERLGGNCTIKVDCRIILASHIDLESAVAEGLFREDLYHRLNILRIHVPSLRDYREDIELLASQFLHRFNLDNRKLRLSNSSLQSMLQYDWPGNVRELKNRMLRAVIMTETAQITEKDLGLKLVNNTKQENKLTKQRIAIGTEALLEALKVNNHNVSAASRQLNISRTTFYRLVKKCNIEW